jgi:hypothetical protein
MGFGHPIGAKRRCHFDERVNIQTMNNAMLLQVCYSNSPYLDLMEVSLMHHFHYARRHQMDFQFIASDIEIRTVYAAPDVNYRQVAGRAYDNWSKVPIIQMWLKQYEYIFYVDADALIVDTTIDLREAFIGSNAGILWCRHPSMFNTGVLFFHKVPVLDALMDAWIAENPENVLPGHIAWDEQVILNRLMVDNRFLGLVEKMDDQWNSSFRTNESPHPVISAWHGACDDKGVRDIGLVAQWMRAALQGAR